MAALLPRASISSKSESLIQIYPELTPADQPPAAEAILITWQVHLASLSLSEGEIIEVQLASWTLAWNNIFYKKKNQPKLENGNRFE